MSWRGSLWSAMDGSTCICAWCIYGYRYPVVVWVEHLLSRASEIEDEEHSLSLSRFNWTGFFLPDFSESVASNAAVDPSWPSSRMEGVCRTFLPVRLGSPIGKVPGQSISRLILIQIAIELGGFDRSFARLTRQFVSSKCKVYQKIRSIRPTMPWYCELAILRGT
jgi:hypothetical protein